jgi:hypothetical protein
MSSGPALGPRSVVKTWLGANNPELHCVLSDNARDTLLQRIADPLTTMIHLQIFEAVTADERTV